MNYVRVQAAADALERVPGLKALTEALAPELEPLTRRAAVGTVERLLGFWVCWNLYGSVDDMIAAGWPRRTLYQHRRDFVALFGMEPERWMPRAARALAEPDQDAGQ